MSKDSEGKIVRKDFIFLDGKSRRLVTHRTEKGIWPIKKGRYSVDVHADLDHATANDYGSLGGLVETVIDSKPFAIGGSAQRAARRRLIASGRLVA